MAATRNWCRRRAGCCSWRSRAASAPRQAAFQSSKASASATWSRRCRISAQAEAPGNLPRAHRLQASLDGSLLLDGLGIRGGRLETFITLRESSVRDPLTGEHRRLNGNRSYWNAEFRHDVPGTPWTWGLFAENGSPNYSYRLDYAEQELVVPARLARCSWNTRTCSG